jgi:hypothetical protein
MNRVGGQHIAKGAESIAVSEMCALRLYITGMNVRFRQSILSINTVCKRHLDDVLLGLDIEQRSTR